MTEKGRNARRFFNRVESDGRIHYTLKSRTQYMDEESKNEKPGKKYFGTTDIEELILTYPLPRKHMSELDKAKGQAHIGSSSSLLTTLTRKEKAGIVSGLFEANTAD